METADLIPLGAREDAFSGLVAYAMSIASYI